MDVELLNAIYSAPAPSGAEYCRAEEIKKNFLKPGYTVSEDNMHNLTIHIPGEGRKLALLFPYDNESFIVRYIENGIAYLYTECEALKELEGKEIVFYTGLQKTLRVENDKLCVDVSPDENLVVGDTAQLQGTLMFDEEKGAVTGTEVVSAKLTYIGLTMAQTCSNDLYVIFTAQNRCKLSGGKSLAVNNVRPDIVYTVDYSDKISAPALEVGGKYYIADKTETALVLAVAEKCGTELEKIISEPKSCVAEIMTDTGVNTLALFLPVSGTLDGQRIDISNTEQMIAFLRGLANEV